MPPRSVECFFRANHFVLFEIDGYGRIPIVHFFQWAMRKNEARPHARKPPGTARARTACPGIDRSAEGGRPPGLVRPAPAASRLGRRSLRLPLR